ncbi:SHD1 domain-containing protein [Rhodopirellula sp. P2]|uniref:SHD1 domain-containing protein n=1 Tax=Rhodopirellula sp. P2 TaxID=2127060 RepID=UPI00236764B6|nr:SHD1 domain-containing protein [Rhodopirellula sp. P2]WDQ16982.1 SHD1 domain-containing protein [Rhodopirellula sp. P2]
MKRSLRLALQWTLVVCMIAILSVSPASAGWLLKRIHGKNADCCEIATDTCCTAPEPVCCLPAPEPVGCDPAPIPCESAPTCCGTVEMVPAPVVSSDCCGSVVVPMSEGILVEQPFYGESTIVPMAEGEMIEGGVIEAPAMPAQESTDVAPPVPAEPVAEEPVIEPQADPAADVEPETPMPVEEPAEEAPVVDPPAAEPVVEEPVVEEPVVEEPVMEEPAADLFPADDNPFPQDAPAEEAPGLEMPAEEAPVEEAPADDAFGDLFGGDTEMPAEPATPDVEAPAAESVEDLFGGDAAPADPVIPDEPAMPEAPADDAFGDLFGGEAEAPADMPAEQPADDGFGDLFGGEAEAPAQEAMPQEGGLDGLFDDAAPAEEAPADGGGLDDLFGDPPAEDSSDAAIDDLFGQTKQSLADSEVTQVVTEKSVAKTIDVLDSTKTRTWIDNTGNWGTDGRLVEVRESEVQILKSNGRTCTVPLKRLSDADKSYVESIRAQVSELLFAMASVD